MKMEFSGGYFDGEVKDNGDFEGKIVYNNGDEYDGVLVGGVFSGKVKKIYPYGEYVGEWRDGEKNGFGKFSWSDGDFYSGEWKAGVMHGTGEFKWACGDVYVGEWKDGVIDGVGKMTWKSGEYYDGEWKAGVRHGKGVYKNPNGNLFEETWLNDVRQTYMRIKVD